MLDTLFSNEVLKTFVDLFELVLIVYLFVWHNALQRKIVKIEVNLETNYAKTVDFHYLIEEVKQTNAGVAQLNKTIDAYLASQAAVI